MKVQDLVFKREALTLPINDNPETWDYLTIYRPDGLVEARSGPHHPEGIIELVHEGFTIVAPSLARNYGEENIYITIASIKEQINSK